MGELDAAEYTAIGTALAALITALATKGVAAVIMVLKHFEERRRNRTDVDILEDEQLEKGLKFAIRKQDKRITQLEQEREELLKEFGILRSDNQLCHTERARLEERVRHLEYQVENCLDKQNQP